MRTILIAMLGVLVMAAAVYAVDSSKPDDHNTSWEILHGKKATQNSRECYFCHEERLECITCHQDTKPRTHTLTWTNKTHGMQARWSRTSCTTCHQEDFCIACHESTEPASHKGNFRNAHCNISCQQPVARWKNTPSKDCLACHTRIPSPTHPGNP